jgi:hypothetical protein
MVIRHLRDEISKRRAARAAREAAVRERAFAVLLEASEPFVSRGLARSAESLTWDGVPAIEVEPVTPGAAKIWLAVNGSLLSLCVGPHGNLHEILAEADGWEAELRACVEAVAHGRYSELERDTSRHRVLTMTFDAQGGPIVVQHLGAHGMSFGGLRELRYPSWS